MQQLWVRYLDKNRVGSGRDRDRDSHPDLLTNRDQVGPVLKFGPCRDAYLEFSSSFLSLFRKKNIGESRGKSGKVGENWGKLGKIGENWVNPDFSQLTSKF